MPFLLWLIGVFLLFAGVACDSSSSQGELAADSTGVEEMQAPSSESEESYAYQVFMTGALSDTLRGDAIFGEVLDTARDQRELVIELETRGDFPGGFFITRGDTVLPTVGEINLAPPTDEAGQPAEEPVVGQYRIVYREGLLRQLHSTEGLLAFEVVSDTLIQGRFDVTLEGVVSPGSGHPEPGQVHARGQFQARPGAVGYIIGL